MVGNFFYILLNFKSNWMFVYFLNNFVNVVRRLLFNLIIHTGYDKVNSNRLLAMTKISY